MAAAEERIHVPIPSPTPQPQPHAANDTPSPPRPLLTRLLHAALAPYAGMVAGWVDGGDPGDVRGGELMCGCILCLCVFIMYILCI